ncbi:MAG: hypothetical protein SGPRY_000650 [Prymnesium sp.]
MDQMLRGALYFLVRDCLVFETAEALHKFKHECRHDFPSNILISLDGANVQADGGMRLTTSQSSIKFPGTSRFNSYDPLDNRLVESYSIEMRLQSERQKMLTCQSDVLAGENDYLKLLGSTLDDEVANVMHRMGQVDEEIEQCNQINESKRKNREKFEPAESSPPLTSDRRAEGKRLKRGDSTFTSSLA